MATFDIPDTLAAPNISNGDVQEGIFVDRIAVIGAGTMGAGIAQVAASHGCTVLLHDVNADAVRAGIEGIAERAYRSVEKGKIKADKREAMLERIEPIESLDQLDDVGLVIEAITEDLTDKRELFAELARVVPDDMILATNTSSLSISKIADAIERPGRLAGMHFFNPAPVMELVEVVSGSETDAAVVDAVCEVARRWNKTPVRVKDAPGFVVNRVARGFYLEALRLLEEGVAG
ncbi:MAG: 3-hydroxyacyl-CoA dehydrogenase NAD-binding domain-containing protein, partial [Phycisphaerae bacterium]